MSAKNIRVAPVDAASARRIVSAYHYSKTSVKNSQLHLGAFYNGRLEGVMSFGPPMDRAKVLPLVRDTPWEGMVELNRLAFSDRLPKNSESRCLSVAARLLKRNAAHIQWVLSFADATLCGDGAIYRAAGFLLTGISKNGSILRSPGGLVCTRMSLRQSLRVRKAMVAELGESVTHVHSFKAAGGIVLPGFQLRYILPLRDDVRERLIVPVLHFSEIDAAGARMYRGRASAASGVDASGIQPEEGGATPTRALSSENNTRGPA